MAESKVLLLDESGDHNITVIDPSTQSSCSLVSSWT